MSQTAWRKPTALGADDMCVDNRDGSVETSSKTGSSKRDPLSRMSVLIEIDETVEGVLVKATGGRSGEYMGVTTVVEDGTRSEGDGTAGERDRDEGVADGETDTDTVAVGIGEGDEDEE